nr:S8 family serine peptidase [uncultured Actinoplanes sp.]
MTGLPPGPAAAATPAAPAPGTPTGQSITLITGDVVALAPAGDGRYAATVRPGPGRQNIRFRTTETKEGVRVVPSDAVPMLADGQLDAELFDVQHLIADGYGDAASKTLPLIVQSGATGTTRAFGAAAGTPLPSIGAVAVQAGKDTLAAFWRTQASARKAADAPRKIWLDGKVKASLDGSAEQIGAPAAWQAGLDGNGVKVAVLDTGADFTHPDLAGRVVGKQDFSTGSTDAADHYGHGTHVAATVAGAGPRPGVAPGAQLLIGKVLEDNGIGTQSQIIEGMQWAAGQGARVINMSLGGPATDGTDPMAAAVDELSASTGALFVVAAGNEGAEYSVGTPGTARSALTVGAVDSRDQLAEFSSRGPAIGQGLKPEVTAPGVDIVAARAAGTTMGEVVDELHTRASGTSMATPHVAGAAAIVAQQHPSWTGKQIKDALVSTAKNTPGTSVYGQGAGRVDLARVVAQKVTGTGVADFGLLSTKDSKPVTKTVTYANGGATPVTLTLTDDLDAVSTDVPAVTVPAGGSATVTVRFDRTKSGLGVHGGWLTATGPDGIRVTTAIGVTLDPPHHKVTFTAVGRDGQPAGVPLLQMFGDDRRFDVMGYIDLYLGPPTFEVAEGDYLVDATIGTDGTHPEDSLVTMPELTVDRDMTVVLDARKANPVTIETPKPVEARSGTSFYVHRVLGSGRQIDNGYLDHAGVKQLNVTPTAKPRRGTYEFSSRWQLEAPLTEVTVPGVSGRLDVSLFGSSPVYQGARRFDLVAGLSGDVRGKAVILDHDDTTDEYAQIQAAAGAGAGAVFIVRREGVSVGSPYNPDGERLPVLAVMIAQEDGRKVLARAKKPGATLTLTLSPSSPYLYDVFQVSPDRVPDRIIYRVTAANSQRITSRYADNGGFEWVREQRFGWRPWQAYSWNDLQRNVYTPSVREEWVSVGDSVWRHMVHHAFPWNDMEASFDNGIADTPTSYRKAGTSSDIWYSPVVRPAAAPGIANTRTGDVLNLRIAQYVDSTDRHWLPRPADQHDMSSAQLYRNGELVADLPDTWRDVPVPAGDATYRLTLATSRDVGADWAYGTSTNTEWTFRSRGSGPLPLLQVSYRAPVALDGTATGKPHLLGVTVPGARSVRVETSSDAGKTWQVAPAKGSSVLVPAGHGTVSLRVTATDRDGNSVRQTILQAYGRS